MVLVKMLLPVAKMYLVNNVRSLGEDLTKQVNEFLLSLYFINLISVVAITFCCLSILSLLTISMILIMGVDVDFQLLMLLTIVNLVILAVSTIVILRSIMKIKVKSSQSKTNEMDKLFDDIERVLDRYLDSFEEENKRAGLDDRLKAIEIQLQKMAASQNGAGDIQNTY